MNALFESMMEYGQSEVVGWIALALPIVAAVTIGTRGIQYLKRHISAL